MSTFSNTDINVSYAKKNTEFLYQNNPEFKTAFSGSNYIPQKHVFNLIQATVVTPGGILGA